MVHTIPNIINGIDNIPMIPNRVKKAGSETRGLLIIQGNGNEIKNQIPTSKIIIFVFLFRFN